jgi:UDP-glucose 4-epimerase
VGTGVETEINRVFAILRQLTGSDQQEQHGPPLAGEQRRSVVDPSKIGAVMGWKPRTSLEDGLRETVRYFRETPAATQAAQPQPA